MLAFVIIPINNINADESSNIPLDDQQMLSNYITAITNREGFNSLSPQDVVFHVGYYEIKKDYLVEQENGLYMIDVTRVTENDYIGPPRNSRLTTTYITLNAPYYSAEVEYVSYYMTGANSGYTEKIYRCYATRNQINTHFVQKPSTQSAKDCVLEVVDVVLGGIPDNPYDFISQARSIYIIVSNYASLTMRNAFRTYAAGGNGGYIDAIDAQYTKTIGYGVWNQSTIEFRSQQSGPNITTNIYRSTSS